MAAATDALAHLGSPEVYDAGTRRGVLERVVLPTEVARLEQAYAMTGSNLGLNSAGQSSEGELVARTVAVGTSVVAYSPDEAVIALWSTGLLGVAGPTSRQPVQETWSTDTVTMRWAGSGWRWASSRHEDGPVPVGSAQVPSAPEDIARAAREFAPVEAGG